MRKVYEYYPIQYYDYEGENEEDIPVGAVPTISVGRYQIGLRGVSFDAPVPELDNLIGVSLFRYEKIYVQDEDGIEQEDDSVISYTADRDQDITANIRPPTPTNPTKFKGVYGRDGAKYISVEVDYDNPPNQYDEEWTNSYPDGAVIIYKDMTTTANDGIYVLVTDVNEEDPEGAVVVTKQFFKFGANVIFGPQ